MSYIEKAKKNIRKTLESNFINRKGAVEKEMNILNILITSFTENVYTYDEYCKNRIKFEIEACEKSLDVNIDKEMEITDQERVIVQSRAMRKSMDNLEVEYEEVMKEEFVKWQLDKCIRLDSKMFYQIYKYSYLKMIEVKLSEEVWKEKEIYFKDISEIKAKKYGAAVADSNKDRHEDDIRSSMI